MEGRKKETPSAIPVCLLLRLVVLKLHAAQIALQRVFNKPKNKTLPDVAVVRASGGQAQRDHQSETTLMSWEERPRRGEGHQPTSARCSSYRPTLRYEALLLPPAVLLVWSSFDKTLTPEAKLIGCATTITSLTVADSQSKCECCHHAKYHDEYCNKTLLCHCRLLA